MRMNFASYLASVPEAWIMGMTTIFFLTIFVSWTLWAWWPSNKERLEQDALLPFEDGEL